MVNFVKLHKDNEEIYLQCFNIMSIKRKDSITYVTMNNKLGTIYLVDEKPEDIIEKITKCSNDRNGLYAIEENEYITLTNSY